MNLLEIDTPAPVISMERVEANLRKMQDYCDEHGIRLRPHIKTHKMVQFAKRQVELGAVGVTCQKIGEAAVMAAGGISDILISFPLVGAHKARSLAALARTPGLTLSVAADSSAGVETLAAAAAEAESAISVLVEYDSGMKRTGVVGVGEALELAQLIAATPGLRFGGLMTYPINQQAVDFAKAARVAFAAAGLDIPLISAGGTPGAFTVHESGVIDEIRAGTYVFNDRNTVIVGAATYEECALEIVAMVVSRPEDSRAIIDAGSKSLTSDAAARGAGGHGYFPDYPGAVITWMSEEHGMVDLSGCNDKPEIGERVRIIPNHVCPVVNLHDELIAVTGEVSLTIAVSARGLSR